jgi:ubiquinone/menaquinone biosynthesis C-methylase UbiE
MVGRIMEKVNMQDNKQKQIWDDLARKNTKYYINTDLGQRITEEQFRDSGAYDYKRLIWDDPLIEFGGTFLEIGCGNGRMTEFIAKQFIVIPIDISSVMITQAKKRLPDIPFYETDGYTIPVKDNVVDIAFSYIVFQHFKTQEMVESNFNEVYRVLKPGGIFKVLVRTDNVDLEKWWGGVTSDETYPVSIGFKLLKKEQVEDYGLWLWLQK